MPRKPSCHVPSYRHHKPTNQAVVTLDGRDFYLGKWNSPESQAEYNRLISEWTAGGRRLPCHHDLTVVELVAGYIEFSHGYYRKNGKLTREYGHVLEILKTVKELYGTKNANEFGPLALKAVRQRMIDRGLSRKYINESIGRIRRCFKWAVENELIRPDVHHGLSAVSGLRKGRSEAHDCDPIQPVEDATVQTTLPHLPVVVADMVRLQRLMGCRPQDVCNLRPIDVDTSGDVWLYRPYTYKTENTGRPRILAIGPKGQDVLRPYLLREKETFCFSPEDSERKRRRAQHEQRRTPLSCGNRPGTNRKSKPSRTPGNRYSTESYRRAIHRGCDRAGIPRWSPNRLRHSAGTEIRARFGLEAAQVVLGHATADVTQVYAQRDLQKAIEVMREVG